MTTDVLRSMYQHMAWADRRVLATLGDAPGADPHALEQFAHVLAAEHLWLSRILGSTAELSVWPSLSIDECERWSTRNVDDFTRLVAAEGEGSLAREIDYVNSAGRAFRSRVVDILVHVAMHGSYHRGMISLMMRRSGGSPAPTDFIAFVRGAPTATRDGGPAVS